MHVFGNRAKCYKSAIVFFLADPTRWHRPRKWLFRTTGQPIVRRAFAPGDNFEAHWCCCARNIMFSFAPSFVRNLTNVSSVDRRISRVVSLTTNSWRGLFWIKFLDWLWTKNVSIFYPGLFKASCVEKELTLDINDHLSRCFHRLPFILRFIFMTFKIL